MGLYALRQEDAGGSHGGGDRLGAPRRRSGLGLKLELAWGGVSSVLGVWGGACSGMGVERARVERRACSEVNASGLGDGQAPRASCEAVFWTCEMRFGGVRSCRFVGVSCACRVRL